MCTDRHVVPPLLHCICSPLTLCWKAARTSVLHSWCTWQSCRRKTYPRDIRCRALGPRTSCTFQQHTRSTLLRLPQCTQRCIDNFVLSRSLPATAHSQDTANNLPRRSKSRCPRHTVCSRSHASTQAPWSTCRRHTPNIACCAIPRCRIQESTHDSHCQRRGGAHTRGCIYSLRPWMRLCGPWDPFASARDTLLPCQQCRNVASGMARSSCRHWACMFHPDMSCKRSSREPTPEWHCTADTSEPAWRQPGWKMCRAHTDRRRPRRCAACMYQPDRVCMSRGSPHSCQCTPLRKGSC